MSVIFNILFKQNTHVNDLFEIILDAGSIPAMSTKIILDKSFLIYYNEFMIGNKSDYNRREEMNLKPCPLCGSETIALECFDYGSCHVDYHGIITCLNCKIQLESDGWLSGEKAMDDVAERWNTRCQ